MEPSGIEKHWAQVDAEELSGLLSEQAEKGRQLEAEVESIRSEISEQLKRLESLGYVLSRAYVPQIDAPPPPGDVVPVPGALPYLSSGGWGANLAANLFGGYPFP